MEVAFQRFLKTNTKSKTMKYNKQPIRLEKHAFYKYLQENNSIPTKDCRQKGTR